MIFSKNYHSENPRYSKRVFLPLADDLKSSRIHLRIDCGRKNDTNNRFLFITGRWWNVAIVNLLRFNDRAGAMISDEEYWVWGRRRSFFTDHIYRVSEDKLNEQLGMELVYGGTGHPPFHLEIVEHLRKKLEQSLSKEDHNGLPTTTEAIGYLLLEEAQNTVQRRVNDHLRFLYGISVDDINRGYFELDGKRFDIKQKKVIDDVTNIVLQKGNNDLLKPLYKSRGVLMGIDPEHGFTAYHLNYDQSILAFVSGGFEAIGTGKYASGIVLGQYLNNKNVAQRREGIDPVEGVYTLFKSAILASESFCQVGGYFSMVLLSQPDLKKLPVCTLVQGDRAKLATEIVQAHRLEQIDMSTCLELLNQLIFKSISLESVEDGLFGKAKNKRLLEWRLSGFKADVESSIIQPTSPASSQSKRSSTKQISKKK